MAEDQHKMAMQAIGLAAQILTQQAEPLVRLVEAERSMHSHLHITDPTLYRRAIGDEGLRQQVKLAKAAMAFIAAVQDVKAEIAEREGRADG
ncbi:hypothetical protein SAMN05444336_11286 [Albimonas donghaensis]|uniref:Uncharacterized protein n=1 Tax=Albimonas donghaensis TaxID=356660 RepID=A0A1H3FFM3_9RHOB|nr:hypothetical protein [Albimonas donghaensis]SDX89567.1 hypothetical protein SAMN05444336_11286 [Albimonas donghaensis]